MAGDVISLFPIGHEISTLAPCSLLLAPRRFLSPSTCIYLRSLTLAMAFQREQTSWIMSSKLVTFFVVALVIFSAIYRADARPEPAFHEVDSGHVVCYVLFFFPPLLMYVYIYAALFFSARSNYWWFLYAVLGILQVVQEGEEKAMEVDDSSCEGIGEDGCLMRRTLAAHVDYLYTQKQKH